MKCPFCGSEMKKGTLRSRGCNFFLPDGEKMPTFYTRKSLAKRNAIPLPPDPFGRSTVIDDWPVAYACLECRKIIMDYGKAEEDHNGRD